MQAFMPPHRDRASLSKLLNDGANWSSVATDLYGLAPEMYELLTFLSHHRDPTQKAADLQIELLQWLPNGADTTDVWKAYLYDCLCYFQNRQTAYGEKNKDGLYWDIADAVLTEDLIRVTLGEAIMTPALLRQARHLVKTGPFLCATANALATPTPLQFRLALLSFVTHPHVEGIETVEAMLKWARDIFESRPVIEVLQPADAVSIGTGRRPIQLRYRKKLPSDT